MNEMDKYLTAIETAIEVEDKEAVELLEAFATHLYQRIDARRESASGEDREVWNNFRNRVQAIIVGMSKSNSDIWL